MLSLQRMLTIVIEVPVVIQTGPRDLSMTIAIQNSRDF